MKRCLAIYRDQLHAARATQELAAIGIAQQHVSLLTSTSASGQLFMARYRSGLQGDHAPLAAIGSTGVRATGERLANGALFVGPIASSLTTQGARTLRDALLTLGIPNTDLAFCCREISDGAVLLSVDAHPGMPEQHILQEALSQAGSLYSQQLSCPST